MTKILLAAGIALAAGACLAWFLSSRPILFTRLFVSRDQRPLVRREILGDPKYRTRMILAGFAQICLSAIAFAGAFYLNGR